MPDLLAQGAAWLEQQRTKHLTTTVTYVRNDVQITIPATIGRTKYEADDGQVVRIEFTDRDYLILTADLVLGGQVSEPQRGDLIREGTRESPWLCGSASPIMRLAGMDSLRFCWRSTAIASFRFLCVRNSRSFPCLLLFLGVSFFRPQLRGQR